MVQTKAIKIGAIGAGSWGTTLANLLADKGHKVDLWVRENDVYELGTEKIKVLSVDKVSSRIKVFGSLLLSSSIQ